MDGEQLCLIIDSGIASGPSGVCKIKLSVICCRLKLSPQQGQNISLGKLTVAVQGPEQGGAGVVRPAAEAMVEVAAATV